MGSHYDLTVVTPWGTVQNDVHHDTLVRNVRLEVVLYYKDSPKFARQFRLYNGDEPLLLNVPIGLAGIEDGDTLKLKPTTEADA